MQKKTYKKQSDRVRNSTLSDRQSLPFISIGKNEKELLRYLKNNPTERFSINAYSKVSKIPRTTIYDYRKRLLQLELIETDIANTKITSKGINYLGTTKDSVGDTVGSLRWDCRTERLSTHYLHFKLTIKNNEKINFDYLKSKSNRMQHNKLVNFEEYYIYFDDCTIVIKSKTTIIHIHDLITDDIDKAHKLAFDLAVKYSNLLKNAGLDFENMILDKAHYARVESYLSKKLHKIDNRYFILLPDGSKFWIDFSNKREDETTSPHYRERVDETMLSLYNTKSTWETVDQTKTDLDKIKDILKMQIHLETLRHTEPELFKKKENGNQKPLYNYFG